MPNGETIATFGTGLPLNIFYTIFLMATIFYGILNGNLLNSSLKKIGIHNTFCKSDLSIPIYQTDNQSCPRDSKDDFFG